MLVIDNGEDYFRNVNFDHGVTRQVLKKRKGSKNMATLECLKCGAEFDGTPEEQVAVFNWHPCEATRELRLRQLEDARRRHPTGRKAQSTTRRDALFVIGFVVLLAALNPVVDFIASLEWFAPVFIGTLFASAFIVLVFNASKEISK